MKPSFAHQNKVLTARYRACVFGDLTTLALLLLQAPFIGWLCTLVWGSVETDTKSLYFVLSLAAVWFGCINSCREIVKERPIVERERLLGLSLPAYIASRFQVLAMIGLAQVILLQLAVEWSLALRGAFVVQTMALWLATLCGIGLGLLVSAMASTQERAVGAIPLLILPQILFSEFAVPRKHFSDLVQSIEAMMPVRWCYDIFTELAALDSQWLDIVFAFLILLVMAAILALLATAALLPRREVVS